MAVKLPPELERLVREAVDRDASDLFLIPGEPPAIRLRGCLERTEAEPLTADAIEQMATAAIGKENMARIGPESGKFQRWCGSPGEYGASICVARTHGEYSIVMRVIKMLSIPTVAEVYLPEAMIKAGESPSGLIVFAGRVGSGKTTGLYSLVDHINANSACHICTVEDSFHLFISPKKALVQQREVGVDVPSFLAGIEAAMNQDLDVLLVGEITNVEELQASITVAETGHLVLTQLHPPASPEAAIQRMIDVFPEDMRNVSLRALAGVLRAVSAQILLPRADGAGRVAAYGVLIPDEEMRQAIAEGRDFMSRKSPMPEGCQTIAEDVERLRNEGTITPETAEKALVGP
ncbi:MAG TPA: Flp pilus assembly complex ATPase component TadA [Candidatus Hydrogenedentes bacterium]|nr:Flp pilus assembly complex ATPase component TadA [Candidatus Hydrogenedentota bacterium]